jgi:hypothetical protein
VRQSNAKGVGNALDACVHLRVRQDVSEAVLEGDGRGVLGDDLIDAVGDGRGPLEV